jgi:hypothetical protein
MVSAQKITIVLIMLLCSFSVLAIGNTVEINNYSITYDYDAEDATTGERFTMGVTLTNLKDVAREEVRFEIKDTNDLTILGDDDFELNTLAPGASVRRTFKVKVDHDLDEDTYELDFKISDSLGNSYGEFEIDVDSVVPEIIIGDVQVLPTILTGDLEDVKLSLTLENIGEGDANYLLTQLNLPTGFTSSSSYSDRANLGIIKQGESKQAVFFIDTDKFLPSGLYQGTLLLDYEDESGSKLSQPVNFDLPVKGKPLFNVVNVKTSPKEVIPGSSVQLGITLQNMGSEKGQETSIRVFENSDLPFSFDEKTNFIGTLKSGEMGRGIFTFNVDDNANANNYWLKIQIRTVNNGDVLVFEETVQIPVVEKVTSGRDIMYRVFFVFLIISVVLAGIVFWKFKSKKNKKNN